jgi:hypothetical protein
VKSLSSSSPSPHESDSDRHTPHTPESQSHPEAQPPITSLGKLADFAIFFVRPLSNVLTQQPHPPRQITQPTSHCCELLFIVRDAVDFELRRFQRTPLFVPPLRTKHQPPTSHIRIAPFLHHIRPRAKAGKRSLLQFTERRKPSAAVTQSHWAQRSQHKSTAEYITFATSSTFGSSIFQSGRVPIDARLLYKVL